MSFWDDLAMYTGRVVRKSLGQAEFEETGEAIRSELSGATASLSRKENPRYDRAETAAEMALQVPDPVKSSILRAYSRNPHVLDALRGSTGGVVVPWNQALSGESREYYKNAGVSARDALLNDYGVE